MAQAAAGPPPDPAVAAAAPAPAGGAGAAAAPAPAQPGPGQTVADLLLIASEAQAAAAAAIASGTAAEEEAARLKTEAEAAKVAAVDAVTAAATAAGLSVVPAAARGAGAAAAPTKTLGEQLMEWSLYGLSRVRQLVSMGCDRVRAQRAPNSVKVARNKMSTAKIVNAPVFDCLDPLTTPGYKEALIASRVSYMLSSDLIVDYLNYVDAAKIYGNNKEDPTLLRFARRLAETIFLYTMSKYEKLRLRDPLEEKVISAGRGAELLRSGSGQHVGGKPYPVPSELFDGINALIRDSVITYAIDASDGVNVLQVGTGAGKSATAPSITGRPDARLIEYADWVNWTNSDMYNKYRENFYSRLEARSVEKADIESMKAEASTSDFRRAFDPLTGDGDPRIPGVNIFGFHTEGVNARSKNISSAAIGAASGGGGRGGRYLLSDEKSPESDYEAAAAAAPSSSAGAGLGAGAAAAGGGSSGADSGSVKAASAAFAARAAAASAGGGGAGAAARMLAPPGTGRFAPVLGAGDDDDEGSRAKALTAARKGFRAPTNLGAGARPGTRIGVRPRTASNGNLSGNSDNDSGSNSDNSSGQGGGARRTRRRRHHKTRRHAHKHRSHKVKTHHRSRKTQHRRRHH